MARPLNLHEDRLFPADPTVRGIARELYSTVASLPIISPHGHTDPRWFAYDQPFANPAELLIVPDHYVFRMLYSQGVRLDELGVPTIDGSATDSDPRAISCSIRRGNSRNDRREVSATDRPIFAASTARWRR